ncbi:MAG: hypothetical protein WB729_20615 [Candidatus Sulfotelmatobacter sp.]|jgi:hypothetical protein
MFKIVPRDEKFFDQLEQLSSLSKSSVEQLGELMERFPQSDGLADRLAVSREEAAKVMQQSLCRLDDAFITPLDRETSCSSSPEGGQRSFSDTCLGSSSGRAN